MTTEDMTNALIKFFAVPVAALVAGFVTYFVWIAVAAVAVGFLGVSSCGNLSSNNTLSSYLWFAVGGVVVSAAQFDTFSSALRAATRTAVVAIPTTVAWALFYLC